MPGVQKLFTPVVCVGSAESQPCVTQSLQYVRGQVEASITEFNTWKTLLMSLEHVQIGDFTAQVLHMESS